MWYHKIMTYGNVALDFTTRNLVYLVLSSLLVAPKLRTEAARLNCIMLDDQPHYQINCDENRASYDQTADLLPGKLDVDATYVYITLRARKPFYVNGMNIFNYFRRLKILRIEGVESYDGGIRIAKDLQWEIQRLRAELFNLPYLQELKIERIKFVNQINAWVLPEHLEDLAITSADYTEYDLRKLRYLQNVNFSGCRFTKLPLFHFPLRSLERLDLRNNPLNGVTTNDIARLCGLTELYIEGTSFFWKRRYCECLRLKKWIQNLMSSENGVKRFIEIHYPDCVSENDTHCKDSDLDLEEATKLRELCLTATDN